MGLRLVDDGTASGDDRAALADARAAVMAARQRLEALADGLAALKARLEKGDGAPRGDDGGTGDVDRRDSGES